MNRFKHIIACVVLLGAFAALPTSAAQADPTSASPQVAVATVAHHLPAEFACMAFAPHPSVDRWGSGNLVTNVVYGYRCFVRHQAPGGGEHYYMVCHNALNFNFWWWVPGIDAWLNHDCTP